MLLRVGSGEGPAGEVEMDICRFEEVVRDFVLVGQGRQHVRADVALAVEFFDVAPRADPGAFGEFGLSSSSTIVVLIDVVGHEVRVCDGRVVVVGVGVDPALHLDGARAVVELVGRVGGLRDQAADLAHERHARDVDAGDAEVGVWVRVVGCEDLVDGAGAEGFFAVGALGGSGLVGWGEGRGDRRGGVLFRWGCLGCRLGSRP